MPSSKRPTRKLRELLGEGFVQENGCVFLAELRSASSASTLNDFPDRTGFECFVNHVHMSDYLRVRLTTGRREVLAEAFAYASALMNVLQYSFESLRFTIILSYDGNDAVVRFHKTRPGEAWVDDDLESYQEEGVGVLTV